MNRRELADVVSELASVLPGRRLNKINAPLTGLVQLVLGKHILWIDLRPGLTGLYLVSAKQPAPATPPAWVMKVRAECAGMPLIRIGQAGEDRVIQLGFGYRDRLERSLVAELFGQRARLLLLDGEDRILAGLIGKAEVGDTYRLPIPPPTGMNETPPSRFPKPDPDRLACNQAVAAHHQTEATRLILERRRGDLGRKLGKWRTRVKRRIKKIGADLNRTLVADSLYRQAEVLKVHLGTVRKGQLRVSLPDPYQPDGDPIEIELDPRRNPVDNMQHMFSRARRLSTARGSISARLEESRTELAHVTSLLEDVAQAGSLLLLQEVADLCGRPAASQPKTSRQRSRKRLPYRTYRSQAGKPILVGRSGPDNHELTFRIARGTDLWLHTRDVAGSHVLIRLRRDEVADQESLLDAATLAAAHSPMRKADKVEITYVLAKHVRPIKGSPPGLVSLSKPRTLLIRMEPERLKRLENSREDLL